MQHDNIISGVNQPDYSVGYIFLLNNGIHVFIYLQQ